MVGLKRLNQFHQAMQVIDAEGVPGDVLEAGIWRGRVIFAVAFLGQQNPYSRRFIAADSFDGLPEPDGRYPVDSGATFHLSTALKVSKNEVLANFEQYRVPLDSVDFLEGWFEDTLPGISQRRLAILRLDGDMYASTRHILDNLYGSISPGGVVIVDDFSLTGANTAVHDFLAERRLSPSFVDIDGSAAFFRKEM